MWTRGLTKGLQALPLLFSFDVPSTQPTEVDNCAREALTTTQVSYHPSVQCGRGLTTLS